MAIQLSDIDLGYLGCDERAPPPLPPINIVNFENYRFNNSWSSSHHEIVEYYDDEEEDDEQFGGRKLMASIVEEFEDDMASDLFSYDTNRTGSDVVYVVVWKGNEELSSVSMDALVWTLKNASHESTTVYLVHIFPELRYIPTPLGKLPIGQVNSEHKEIHLIQERSKRSEYLQRFLGLCSSTKVKVETMLIESDMEAKAILDLIPILNITKLVLGASKSTLRKIKSSSKKGIGGTVDQILHNAPEFCEVKIICEGKEASLQDQSASEAASPTPSPRLTEVNSPKTMEVHQEHVNYFVNCSCFKL